MPPKNRSTRAGAPAQDGIDRRWDLTEDPDFADRLQASIEEADADTHVARSVSISREVLERARATVVGLQYKLYSANIEDEVEPDSLAKLFERAVLREIIRIEQQYNNGDHFRRVAKKLRTGPTASGGARGAAKRAAKRKQQSTGEDT